MALPKVSIVLSVYRAERYLRCYLQSVLEQSTLSDIELSIVHNDPSAEERSIIDEFSGRIRIVRCEIPRESLYASWNRAIAQSHGEYLACWNADDLRSPDSLERMARTLNDQPQAGWTYGDFVLSRSFGTLAGRLVATPEWTSDLATRGAIGGPFFMWRRSLLQSVGWFDEQFRSGGDFDYTVRLTLGSIGQRTPGTIGYFLDEHSGLSTSGNLQPIERTVVQLRYGIYETLDWLYVHSALQYRVRHLLQPGGHWVPVNELAADYDALIASRRYRVWKSPIHTLKAAFQRQLANRLGRPCS